MSEAAGRGLRILAADEDSRALEELSRMLEGMGHEVTAHAVDVERAADLIATEEPDLAMVVLHRDDEHALALIGEIVTYAAGPVVALLERQDSDFIARAADLGIDAYAQPVEPESVQGAIEVAVRRHAELGRLAEKVDQLQTALDRRAIIERAKGILMERHGIGERAAFELLRDHARRQSRAVVDVAGAVADGHTLLPRRP